MLRAQPEYGPFWDAFAERVRPESRNVPWTDIEGWRLEPRFIHDACWLMRGDRLALSHLRLRFEMAAHRLPEGSSYSPECVASLLERWAREAGVEAMREFPELRELSQTLMIEGRIDEVLGMVEARIDEVLGELQGPRAARRELARWRERFGRRARGVRNLDDDTADFFVGRLQVLRHLVAWLADPVPSETLLVLSGEPGCGKSALLARLIAMADPELREGFDLTAASHDSIPEPGAISVAIDARDKGVEQVVDALAAGLGVNASDATDVGDGLVKLAGSVVLAVDSLDESKDPRALATLLRDVSQRGTRGCLRVVVATRPGGPRREWLTALGGSARVIDLDDTSEYFDADDVVEMVVARLCSDPRAPEGYRLEPRSTARLVAKAVERRARGAKPRGPSNFLVAALIAASLVLGSDVVDVTIDGWEENLPANLGEAFDALLDRFEVEDDRARARDLLTALAFAKGLGLPYDEYDLWPRLAEALGLGRYDRNDVRWLLTTGVADLIEQTDEDQVRHYNLFHRELVDYLARGAGDGRRANSCIYDTLLKTAPRTAEGRDWKIAPPYVCRHLSAYAGGADRLEELFADPGFLVAADPAEVTAAMPAPGVEQIPPTQRTYRHAARFLRQAPTAERASYLGMAARQSGEDTLAEAVRPLAPQGAWRASWCRWQVPECQLLTIDAGASVEGVALTELRGHPVAVSASEEGGTLRVWDLTTGELARDPLPHACGVTAVAVGRCEGRPVAVFGDPDGTLRVWDLITGKAARDPISAHASRVTAVAVGQRAGRLIAVSAGEYDDMLRVWDLTTGNPDAGAIPIGPYLVSAFAFGEHDGRPIALYGDSDGTLRMVDLTTGEAVRDPISAHADRVTAVAVGQRDGRPVAVSGDKDGTLRVWDLTSGKPDGDPVPAHESRVTALALGHRRGHAIAVSGSYDATLRVWDLTTGNLRTSPAGAHQSWVGAVAVGQRGGHPIAVSGGDDGTLRVWDLTTGKASALVPDHESRVMAVAVGHRGSHPIAVSASLDGTLRVWDLTTGKADRDPLAVVPSVVTTLAVVQREEHPLVVCGVMHGTLWVWDLTTGELDGDPLPAHQYPHWVTALAVARRGGHAIAVSGAGDGTLRVWDLTTGKPDGDPVFAHHNGVNALAVGQREGHAIAVSGGGDGMLRVWDLTTGKPDPDPVAAHRIWVTAIATTQRGSHPIAVSAGGEDGMLRAWQLDSPLDKSMRTDIYVGSMVMAIADTAEGLLVGAKQGLMLLTDAIPG